MGNCCDSTLASYEKWTTRLNNTKNEDIGAFSTPRLLSPRNYLIGPFIAEGGMGTVYVGIDKSSRQFVALKFFGYTQKKPVDDNIAREISLMMAMNGVQGTVQIHGIFMDTCKGRVAKDIEKVWIQEYPVIVMDYLDGGAVYDVIQQRDKISEFDLRRIFKEFIEALDSIHSRGYIHNDIKLENIMLERQDDPLSAVKIIDVGFMRYLPAGKDIYLARSPFGTPGYMAPETLTHCEFSRKTDMWQAGCVLYSMLSGISPFHAEDHAQTITGRYFPMTGDKWNHISDPAIDLISRILLVPPSRRLSAREVLSHPWLNTDAPRIPLGESYNARIKQLALRQKLRAFFLNHDVAEKTRIRVDHVKRIVARNTQKMREDMLSDEQGSSDHSSPSKPNRASRSKGSLYESFLPSVSTKAATENNEGKNNKSDSIGRSRIIGKPVLFSPLHGLDGIRGSESESEVASQAQAEASGVSTVSSLSSNSEDKPSNAVEDISVRHWIKRQYSSNTYDDKMGTFRELMVRLVTEDGGKAVDRIAASHHSRRGGQVDYHDFVSVITEAGLPDLARREIFGLFDIGNKGSIDLMDFLLTMLALQPGHYDDSNGPCESTAGGAPATGGVGPDRSDTRETAQLYFSLFDLHDTGYIELEEFRLALGCILETQPKGRRGSMSTHGSLHSAVCVEDIAPLTDRTTSKLSLAMQSTASATFYTRHTGNMSYLQAQVLDSAQVDEMFQIIDSDKDGRISIHDFQKFYDTIVMMSDNADCINMSISSVLST